MAADGPADEFPEMTRVLLRVSALLAAALALAFLYLESPESSAGAGRPLCERCNVVLISFDTVRADHLGAYGYQRPTSPNVDSLAERSVVFDRAISQAPWTLPAHGSMMSGLYPRRLGVLRYPATRVLPDSNTTLAEAFRAAGYATGAFTGGGFVAGHYGFDRGFDIYASKGRRFEHNLDETIDWIDKHKRKPFFLFVHGYDAHRPYYSKAADKTLMGLPETAESEQSGYCLSDDRARPSPERLESVVRYYDAAIHHGDRAIGVLLRTLEQLDLMEDTVILLTSDHGEEFFEHGNCDHVRFVYEESVHVPYMLYVPRLMPDARHIDGLIPASISVARTLLETVGVENAMPGVTVLPMIVGRQKDFPVVYSEADSPAGALGSRGACSAILKGDSKLISYTDEGADEAYDLFEDPGEKHILPERDRAYTMRPTLRAWGDAIKPLPKPKRKRDRKADKALEEDNAAISGGAAIDDGRPKVSALSLPGADVEEGLQSDGAPKKVGVRKQKRLRPGKAERERAAREARERQEEEGMKVPKELEEELKSLGYLE